MPRLLSIPQVVGSYLLEASAKNKEPSLERMVPVHHYDSNHVWVWMTVVGMGYIHGPVKITHADVTKHKKKLATPAGPFLMAGKLDPFAYKKGEIFSLDWVPGSTDKPGDKQYVSFTPGKGLPDSTAHEQPDVSSISGWVPDSDEFEPDEYGWVYGEYEGVDAMLNAGANHILDFESNKVLWPEHLKPSVNYKLQVDLDPAGSLDSNGFVLYHAHDPEGLELSLLPSGILAVLNNNEYQPHKRDYDGEMIPTGDPIPVSSVLKNIPKQKDPPPKPKPVAKKKATPKPLPKSKPEPVAKVAPEPSKPEKEVILSPEELGWYDQPQADGLFGNSKFPELFKAPDGKFYLQKITEAGVVLYSLVALLKGHSAEKKTSWMSKGLAYVSQDIQAKYNPKSIPKMNEIEKLAPATDETGQDVLEPAALHAKGLKKLPTGEYGIWTSSGSVFAVYQPPTKADPSDPANWPKPHKELHISAVKDLYGSLKKKPEENKGWIPMNYKDAYGFPVFKWKNGMEYSKLPGGWALFMGGTGKYHYYKPTPQGGMELDKETPPEAPEEAGSKVAAAKQDRVFKTSYGELKNGFFATPTTAASPNTHGAYKVYHSNPDSEEAFDWYQMPNGTIAHYDSMTGKYYVASGSGDMWSPSKMALPPEALASMQNAVKKEPSALLPKDLHGFPIFSANDIVGKPVVVSKLPFGLLGTHGGTGAFDRYQLVRIVDDVVQYEADGSAGMFPTISWLGAKQLRRKKPVVGDWRVAGVDGSGALLLSRGKSKAGTVRLMPTGYLAKFTGGKYKQAKYDEKTGKVNLLKNGIVWSTTQVRKDARNVSLGIYVYTGPGAVEDLGTVAEPEKPVSTLPIGWEVHNVWNKFTSEQSVKKGDYNLKPVTFNPESLDVTHLSSADMQESIYLSKTFNLYVTPKGVVVLPTAVTDNFFAFKLNTAGVITTDQQPEEKWAHELGIVIPKPVEQPEAEASVWNPPSGFEVSDKNWGKGFKAKLVKKHDFNIMPIVWKGSGASKLSSASGTGTLFLTPSGDVITPQTYEDGKVFWVWSHEKGNWGPPKTAAQLGIVKEKTPPASTGTTAGGKWNPPEGWVLHDKWNKVDGDTALDPDKYDANPVNYVGDKHSYLSMFGNLNTYINKTGILFYTALLPGGSGIEFRKIEWSNGMSTGYPKTTASALGILKPGVSVDVAEPLAVMPKPPVEKPFTAPVLNMNLPDVSELQFDSDGTGMKGAGKKSIYKDAKGNRFLFKPALPKSGNTVEPFRAYSQEVSSVLALEVREDHIPVKAVELEGTFGTIQPLLELGDPSDLSNYPPSKLTDQEKLDVAHEHIIDWIGSQHDSHRANLVRTKSGQILSIDKEQGFKYWGKDELSTDYHPNAQYGESEPYYNTFWKAFASGEVDFDPQSLASTFDVIQKDMDWSAVEGSLRKYARERFPKNTFKQEAFLAQVRSRKNTAKRDFERFISEQYRKRTGEEGNFTFANGWKKKGEVVYKEIKTDVASWTSKPNKAQVSLPVSETETVEFKLYEYMHEGKGDDSLLTLKIANTYESAMGNLQKVLNALGVTAISSNQGSAYTMVVVRKSDLKKSGTHSIKVKQVEAGKLNPHEGTAQYLPKVDFFAEAESNFNEATALTKSKTLGLTGKYIFLDTDIVEGQTATIRRYKRDGEEYTAVHFKVRDAYVGKIKGTSSEYKALQGGYGESTDAIDQTGGKNLLAHEHYIKSQVFSLGSDAIYGFPKNKAAFALKGQIIIEMKGSVSSFKSRARPLLEGLMPSVPADKILTEVKEKDRRVLKTWRLLNALYPAKHDALLASGKTTEADALHALQYEGQSYFISDVQEVEVVSGYVSHVLPNLWKRARNAKGEPLLKFLSHSTNTVAVVPSVLRHGFMGHIGRVFQGSPAKGAVVATDFRTGGADTMQCRVCTEATLDKSTQHGSISGSIQFILSPDVADRLDAVFHHHDAFGDMTGESHKGRKSLEDRVSGLKLSHFSEEMVFPRGLHSDKLLRIVCSSASVRTQVIEECLQNGVTEHRGVPIEDFVVIEPVQRGVYEKYVKPAGY